MSPADASAPGALPPGRPRSALVAEVRRSLGSLPAGARALVAVSGGPDSTALAYLAAEARPDLDLTLAHVRHGLREDAHDRDVVARHATFLGLSVESLAVDVDPSGEGVEAAARRARYDALSGLARRRGIRYVLVGHTAEDQAETVLLRLARSTGVDGLCAMRTSAPLPGRGGGRLRVVRPLLRIRRADVHAFVEQEGLPAATDPTNTDLRLARARVRHRILPELEELAGDPVGALARLADLAAADVAALGVWVSRVRRELVRQVGPVAVVATTELDALPAAVAGRLVRTLLRECQPPGARPVQAAEVARVRHLAPGQLAEVGSVVASCGGGWLAVAPQDVPAPPEAALAVPGRTPWPTLGAVLTVDTPDSLPTAQPRLDGGWRPTTPPIEPRLAPPGGESAAVQVLVGELGPDGGAPVVRTRRPGDRLRTRSGARPLARVLVDRGVPRLLRELLPVVAVGERVVWVPGVATDEDALAAGHSDPRVLLRLTGG